jgi:hypothetical protein
VRRLTASVLAQAGTQTGVNGAKLAYSANGAVSAKEEQAITKKQKEDLLKELESK